MAELDEDDFLGLGFESMNVVNWRNRAPKRQITDFKSLYGTHPRIIAELLKNHPHLRQNDDANTSDSE